MSALFEMHSEGNTVQATEFVQILHIDGNHRITISTMGCKVGEVNLYDCNQCESLASTIDITHRDWQHQALNGNRLLSDVTP